MKDRYWRIGIRGHEAYERPEGEDMNLFIPYKLCRYLHAPGDPDAQEAHNRLMGMPVGRLF